MDATLRPGRGDAMKKILFVEDNPVLLELYGIMLTGEPHRWQVRTASCGQQALEFMETTTFDAVISDLEMPGMDGIQLLREVKRRSPATARIMVSGVTDQKLVAESLHETHQFMAKPINSKTVKTTLLRINRLDAFLQNAELKQLVAQLDTLPSFPSLYLEIMQELASDDVAIEKIAAIIAKDPGMTVKMLQIVNSAATGLGRKVTNPEEAVQYVGMATVRALALSAHIFSCFEHTELEGFSIQELWDHAMRSAALARKIMTLESAEAAQVEDAYIAAMLHDVGKLMLANNLPEQFQLALRVAREQQISFPDAEHKIFGATHAGVGAYLLGLWGMPSPIVEAVALHHSPNWSETKSFEPLTAVHAANALEHELTGRATARSNEIDLEYLKGLAVDNHFERWREHSTTLLRSATA
jgi:HD-like signal output (HDOD) protein